MDSGWIKIHRKITEWEWYTDANTVRLFLHLLIIANHKDTKWRGVFVPAGSLLTGRIQLAEALGISQQSVRTSLEHLKSTNEITIKSTNKFSIISITSWNIHQQISQQDTKRTTSNQPATNHIQELKNDKNEKKEENNGFAEFWTAYPRKTAKPKAAMAYAKAIKKIQPAELLTKLKGFKFSDEQQYIPHPASWLNAERWKDEPMATNRSSVQQSVRKSQGSFAEERAKLLGEQ